MVKELRYELLRNYTEDDGYADVDFNEGNNAMIGQERAEKAMQLGLRIKSKGYNIYVSGPAGSGKTTFAKAYAEAQAASEPVPPDLCYIYNFEDPKKPKALVLPPGTGVVLKDEMEELLERLQEELPKVLSTKDVENRKSAMIKEFQARREEIIKVMTAEAKKQNFGVKTTNSGVYFMPIVDGEVISEEQFDDLSQEQKENINHHSESIQKQAADIMRIIKDDEKNTRREVADFEYSVGLFTVGRYMNQLLEKYAAQDNVFAYLMAVKEDVLENMCVFLEREPTEEEETLQSIMPWYSRRGPEETFHKYRINVLTDNSKREAAPVIVDFNPTYANLVGEVEYDNEYGNLITDFLKIKPGLLHNANGGYLILQAQDVLMGPHCWEIIRRALLTGEIVTEPLREFTTGVPMAGVHPEPVPVDCKIILVGSPYYYDLLYDWDDNFHKIFRIIADFDDEMDRTRDNAQKTIRYIQSFAKNEKLGAVSNAAVKRILRHASRLADNQEKLTTRFHKIGELLIESAAWAQNGTIEEINVLKAIEERDCRLRLYEDKLTEMIGKNQILIDTSGQKIGQINGLAVFDNGEYVFAKPSRITATAYMGKAGIINIEKEADMSGNIHEKGVQVLAGFLGQTYAQDFPLSLSSRICFEQTYGGVDGDSASSAELYAVLSSLAGLPINQELAVTGSINQRGEIQTIGGVTHKVECFFALCQQRGLTGRQGVIIPVQNVRDLVLKDEVIDQVKEGMFHIYPIDHVDEGIELLTGVPAGAPNDKGKFPANTVHGRVYRKLREFYKRSSMAE